MMKHLAFAAALLIAAVTARGEESLPRYGGDFATTFGVAREIDRLASLLADDVLRDMVCRLSYQRYTFGSLNSALGMPEGQVMRRINTLRGWGLVRMVRHDSARTLIEPIPGGGDQTLRRWADRYCPLGDTCARPAANSENHKNGRARTASRLGGEVVDSHPTGASNLKDKLVMVFGGAGFLGRDLVMHLLDAGARVRVASRNPDPALLRKLQSGNDRLTVMTVDVRDDPAAVKEAVVGASMVVNLVGMHREWGDQEFIEISRRGVRAIASAAAAEAERFVHISGISADPKSPFVHGRNNAAGEAAAVEEFPEVTLVRPSLVVHPEGGFVKQLLEMSRYNPDYALSFGRKTLFQAVYIGDVSKAIVRILEDPGTKGKTYELGGPRAIPLHEIVAIVTREAGRLPPLFPIWLAEAQAAIFNKLPKRLWKQNHVTSLTRDNVVRPNALGLVDLGLTPTPIEDMMPAHRERGERSGEFAPAY